MDVTLPGTAPSLLEAGKSARTLTSLYVSNSKVWVMLDVTDSQSHVTSIFLGQSEQVAML